MKSFFYIIAKQAKLVIPDKGKREESNSRPKTVQISPRNSFQFY